VVLTAFGVVALVFMMAMYAMESRGPEFVLAFAAGCALSSSYGFASGAWPFDAVEAIWTAIAVRRWHCERRGRPISTKTP
jgi:hypothetical protein